VLKLLFIVITSHVSTVVDCCVLFVQVYGRRLIADGVMTHNSVGDHLIMKMSKLKIAAVFVFRNRK